MKNNLSIWKNDLFRPTFPLSQWGDFSDFFHAVEESYRPKCDVRETASEFIFNVDLPGVNKSDVKIELEKNVLTISGKRESEKTEEKDSHLIRERNYGEFFRSFQLPAEVDQEKIEAKQKDGVLVISVPKTKQAKPRLIEVA